MRTVCGPHVPPLKSSVKSYFPTSNADSDSRFEFYAKKHVQNDDIVANKPVYD